MPAPLILGRSSQISVNAPLIQPNSTVAPAFTTLQVLTSVPVTLLAVFLYLTPISWLKFQLIALPNSAHTNMALAALKYITIPAITRHTATVILVHVCDNVSVTDFMVLTYGDRALGIQVSVSNLSQTCSRQTQRFTTLSGSCLTREYILHASQEL